MVTTVKGLNNYQKTLIVHIVALDSYSDEERAEHLKSLDFCTDDVKCQVLMELERTIKQVCKLNPAITKKKKSSIPVFQNHRKRWPYEETMRLIKMYNDGTYIDDIADAFKTNPNAINTRINWLRKHPSYHGMIRQKRQGRRKENDHE